MIIVFMITEATTTFTTDAAKEQTIIHTDQYPKTLINLPKYTYPQQQGLYQYRLLTAVALLWPLLDSLMIQPRQLD